MGRRLLAFVLTLGTLLMFSASGAAAEEPTAEALARAAADRAAYGLPSDQSTVEQIIRSDGDVGTEKWGIVLTAAEEAQLDLPGRMEFVSRASEELIPYARGLRTFAGLYFVPSEDGRLVIALTDVSADQETRIRALMPAPSREIDLITAKYTFDEIKVAAEKTWTESWYHAGYGLVGLEVATMYPALARDIMRVEMNDAQASDRIYHSSFKEVVAARAGNTGETVCTSLGVTNTYPCQIIENQWTSWTSFSCNCTMWGADLLNGGGVSTEGDSGSPWFAQYGSLANGVWAIGVFNTPSKFTHVSHGLSHWGAGIVN